MTTTAALAGAQRTGPQVVVGEPRVHRAEAIRLGEYVLGLYASHSYLVGHGIPETLDDLMAHPLVYFKRCG